MKEELRIEIEQEPQHAIQALEDKLYVYNSNTINRHDGRLFSKTIRDENGNLLAGVGGWTWASACEITLLWVREDMRSKGIGSKLLEAAEEEAIGNKCNTILARSYSFQAPYFYERNGYRVEHIIENFPNGYRYFSLIKTLGSDRIGAT